MRVWAQVEAKSQILYDALRRLGRIELGEPPEVVASPDPYGYRARTRVLTAVML